MACAWSQREVRCGLEMPTYYTLPAPIFSPPTRGCEEVLALNNPSKEGTVWEGGAAEGAPHPFVGEEA